MERGIPFISPYFVFSLNEVEKGGAACLCSYRLDKRPTYYKGGGLVDVGAKTCRVLFKLKDILYFGLPLKFSFYLFQTHFAQICQTFKIIIFGFHTHTNLF